MSYYATIASRLRTGWAGRGALGLALLGLGGCIESYTPAVVNAPNSYLVVDGFINGNGVTRITLSRSVSLATTGTPPTERGARVQVVDEAGSHYALTETSSGTYRSDSLLLPAGRRYQLRITTAGTGAATYESDLTTLKVTPPIDKLGFQLANGQVQVLVSAHDASAQTKYYRWSFVETWEFNAAFRSVVEYYPNADGPHNTLIDTRTTPIYTCWRTERPTDIVQTTSAQLSQDAISNYVVRSFSDKAERTEIRYSVLVSQMAETAEEFAYLELLRKNTEAVGTVNDPLPVQLVGNVHRVGRPDEPVLGFVGAHTVQRQRLFINQTDLPAHNSAYYISPYNNCLPAPLCFCDQFGCDEAAVVKLFASTENTPIDKIVNDPGCSAGILGASTACADCRTRGVNKKPAFW